MYLKTKALELFVSGKFILAMASAIALLAETMR